MTEKIDESFKLGLLRLIRNMEVDSVLTLVSVARVQEINWAVLPNQE